MMIGIFAATKVRYYPRLLNFVFLAVLSPRAHVVSFLVII
ncbi:hypothetical protein SAMN05443550_102524 [Pedobacter hartonius]|uniref:Uncharacterized protein n=1 Tax=Pedobacter hartonius TaxID=425514 RepID=A0A1H3ZWY3_9SPHI|nr:hypothetical protein SAMN05443550_102524 [Pedobacter hartonius]